MLSYVVRRAKALGMLHKVVVVHADLGRAEWDGTRELAELQARLAGVRRFEVVRASGADLLDRVEIRYGKLKAKAEKEARERDEDPTTAKVAPARTARTGSGPSPRSAADSEPARQVNCHEPAGNQ